MSKLRKIKAPIPLLCYGVCLIGFLAMCLWHFAGDSLARANGRLAEAQMTAADFVLAGLEQQADGTLVTLDGDPQMIWENPDGRVVRTLRVEAGYSDEPREVCLYYTNRAGGISARTSGCSPRSRRTEATATPCPTGHCVPPAGPLQPGREQEHCHRPGGGDHERAGGRGQLLCAQLVPVLLPDPLPRPGCGGPFAGPAGLEKTTVSGAPAAACGGRSAPPFAG